MLIARILLTTLLISGCASIDVETIKHVAKDGKITLIDLDKDSSVVLRRDKPCHCPMLKYELKF